MVWKSLGASEAQCLLFALLPMKLWIRVCEAVLTFPYGAWDKAAQPSSFLR